MVKKPETVKKTKPVHATDYPFSRKKGNIAHLISYGFIEQGDHYVFSTPMTDIPFLLQVTITKKGDIQTKILDSDSGEEYVLHRDPLAKGEFVGKVRTEYRRILEEIAQKCFETDVFQSEQARKIIGYIREKYQTELEFLWERFPQNAIFRRRDTGKWYGILLVLSKRKLGLASDDPVNILDLRIKTDEIETLLDNKTFFPGYHMNKKHWFTICLDKTVSIETICQRIDDSYLLAK